MEGDEVILTNTQAAIQMRLHTDPDTDVVEPLNSIIERHLATADALIQKRTVNLPQAVRINVAIMLTSHLYDSPLASFSNTWIRSGAYDICRPWLRRRAGVIERT